MAQLAITQLVNIGGVEYKIGRLNVANARKALSVLYPILGMYDLDSDGVPKNAVSVMLLAGLTDSLPEEKQSILVDLFSQVTSVTIPAEPESRVLPRLGVAAQDELWSGQLERMIEWLDACIAFNFGGVIAKTRAVATEANAQLAAAKAAEDQT